MRLPREKLDDQEENKLRERKKYKLSFFINLNFLIV